MFLWHKDTFLWHKDTFLWHKDTFSWHKVFFLWHKLFSNYLQYVTNQLPLRLLIVLKLTNKTSETPHKTLKDQWRLLSICFLKKFFLQKLLIWAFFTCYGKILVSAPLFDVFVKQVTQDRPKLWNRLSKKTLFVCFCSGNKTSFLGKIDTFFTFWQEL